VERERGLVLLPAPDPVRATIAAIRSMQVRGAAAIGVAGAEALAHHVTRSSGPAARVLTGARSAARRIDAARPTAVTLHNALGQVLAAMAAEDDSSSMKDAAKAAARKVAVDAERSRAAIARHGARQVPDGGVVLTHCHSGTAVAVLAQAVADGKTVEAIATETRPFRQGLRTVRDLRAAGLEVGLIVDSAVEHVLSTRDIDLVLVGADAVARDGTLVNKIGTAGVAALAGLHEVPFLSAAGLAKFTRHRADEVPIEERTADEVVAAGDLPRGVRVLNPVFDCTPPDRVKGYVTEAGLLSPAAAVRRNLAKLPREEVWG
jgi:eIF-2B alpha/beta/delta-like uncharacterized protein